MFKESGCGGGMCGRVQLHVALIIWLVCGRALSGIDGDSLFSP